MDRRRRVKICSKPRTNAPSAPCVGKFSCKHRTGIRSRDAAREFLPRLVVHLPPARVHCLLSNSRRKTAGRPTPRSGTGTLSRTVRRELANDGQTQLAVKSFTVDCACDGTLTRASFGSRLFVINRKWPHTVTALVDQTIGLSRRPLLLTSLALSQTTVTEQVKARAIRRAPTQQSSTN